ncbi:unnamed protein product [Dibothriocephalus latus]|uniref:Integrase catalytic domain-containing protein n=1 Tax=Dibothriocephalus latus TaxID=60516 RepID=A0A3P6RN97_DIBLA|nr:unnamed protein product [Dibothriocephalus latus]
MAPFPLQRTEVGWYPFKCVGTKAVHLEMAFCLSTDSFLQCLMRFVSRRGKPTDIYSDNGTNFVGSVRELRSEIKRWDQRVISDQLLTSEIQWHFNPPAASHRGGLWERVIRLVRRILISLCKEQCVNDERLNTLFVQTERILNNRALIIPAS